MIEGVPMGRSAVSPRRTNSWFRVLLMGMLFYILAIVVLFLTHNPNLFPTALLLGSFMVPAAYVSFFYERRHLSQLSMPSTVLAFVYGGVLGTLGASLLEPLLVGGRNLLGFFTVGLIEEFVKILGVLVIARRRRCDSELDGLILGAAAGMGFAALESTGYGFTAFLESRSLSFTFSVVFIRAFLAPVGHGTWTAILASVLFRECGGMRFHISSSVVGAYLVVAFLHGAWDALPDIITKLFSVSTIGPAPLALLAGQMMVGIISFLILWRRWREGKRQQLDRNEPAAIEAPQEQRASHE